jgi:hypothetical protein
MKAKKINKAARVRNLLRKNPNAKAGMVVEMLDCTMQQAHVMLNIQRKQLGIIRLKDGTFKGRERMLSSEPAIAGSLNKAPNIVETHYPIVMEEPKADPVNHPEHYKVGGIETIDFIEAKSLGYNLGNVVKYITRSDHKGNKLQDLQKAQWYLNREINKAQA